MHINGSPVKVKRWGLRTLRAGELDAGDFVHLSRILSAFGTDSQLPMLLEIGSDRSAT
jgi:hypothetical protein